MYKRTKNDPRLTKNRQPLIRGFFTGIKDFFVRRGTDPWRVNLTKKSVPWSRILAPVLLVTIPLFVIMVADNTILRLSDLYKYHFLSSEILGEKMVAVDEDDVSQLMSDYFLHKTDRFQIKEDLEYMPADVFTKADGTMIRELRSLLDAQAIVGLFMLLVTVLLIIFLLRQKERDLLLQSFYYSLPVFALMKIIEVALMLFGPLRNRVFGIPTVEAANADDLIPALLDNSFFQSLVVAESALSLIFLGVIYYIILNLAGRKTTFRR
jgi:cbb3-type cytochrome oxidase subunit 3